MFRITGIFQNFLVLVFAVLTAATAAWADKTPVACVQGQLKTLGFSPGQIDGIIGKKSRAAYRAMAKKDIAEKLPAQFEAQTALVICRELGLVRPQLRRFWPSVRDPVNIVFTESMNERTRQTVKTVVADAIGIIESEFDVRLAGRIDIAVGEVKGESAPLRGLLETISDQKIEPLEFAESLQSVCPAKAEMGGFATSQYTAICFPRGNITFPKRPYYRGIVGNRRLAELYRVVLHELIHEVQFQSMVAPAEFDPFRSLENFGPEWLIEGVADYFTYVALLPKGRTMQQFVDDLRRDAGGHSKNLELYSVSSARIQNVDALYNQGLLATYMLALKNGDQSLFRFYRDLGLGVPWQAAFEGNFGQRPRAFYAEFGGD